jgi:hypothetical protein
MQNEQNAELETLDFRIIKVSKTIHNGQRWWLKQKENSTGQGQTKGTTQVFLDSKTQKFMNAID